jgi:hypothetical protein
VHITDRAAPALAVLDEREQAVMDDILSAMRGIQSLGLRTNQTELAMAVHVLQGFVIQHMLQRIAPGHWGAWFGPGAEIDGDSRAPDAT